MNRCSDCVSAGAQHGGAAGVARVGRVGGALRRAARAAAHGQRARGPRRAHRRARLRPLHREVLTRLRLEILPINRIYHPSVAYFKNDRNSSMKNESSQFLHTIVSSFKSKLLKYIKIRNSWSDLFDKYQN